MKERIEKVKEAFLFLLDKITSLPKVIKIIVSIILIGCLLFGGYYTYISHKPIERTTPTSTELLISMEKAEKNREGIPRFDINLSIDNDGQTEDVSIIYACKGNHFVVSNVEMPSEAYYRTSYGDSVYESYTTAEGTYVRKKGILKETEETTEETEENPFEQSEYICYVKEDADYSFYYPYAFISDFLSYENEIRYKEVSDDGEETPTDDYMHFLHKNSSVNLTEDGGYLLSSTVSNQDVVQFLTTQLENADDMFSDYETENTTNVSIVCDSDYNLTKISFSLDLSDFLQKPVEVSCTIDVSYVSNIKPDMEYVLTQEEFDTLLDEVPIDWSSDFLKDFF